MDEWVGIAAWILIIFLSVNTAIVWFNSSTTLAGTPLVVGGVSANNSYTVSDLNSVNYNIFGVDCSTVTSSDFVNATACTLSQVQGSAFKFVGDLWNFLTAWATLLDQVLIGVPAGDLFKAILIPFFGLIEFLAIFAITLQVAGIIRGGS